MVLTPGDAQTLTFEVDLKTTGRFPVAVRVVAPGGEVIGGSSVVVRSTAYSRSLIITIAAGLVLVLVWGQEVRRHDGRRETDGGPGAGGTRDRRPAAEDSTSAFVRNTAVMAVGTSLSRLTGFLRIAAMAFALGITETRLADAYNTANVTPNLVYELVLGGVLSSVLVPVFVEWMQRRGAEASWEVARRLFTLAFITLTAITIVTIVAAPWIVRLYTIRGGPDVEATRELATFLLRWFMPRILFYGLGAVATGLLNAHRRFAAPMFTPILNNPIAIGTFLLFAAMRVPSRIRRPRHRRPAATRPRIGTTLGVVAMTAGLWPSLRATGFRFAWRPQWRDEAISRIVRLAGWVVVYVAANQAGGTSS